MIKMGLRLNKDEFLKKEKVILPEDIQLPSLEEYDFDSFGDAFIMMPKMEEDQRQKNLEKNIKKEWLEPIENKEETGEK
ncbi:hypothetical protein [uncultured Granulicatella sp.]|uniref:hypothetical protein n=1 Tax=uncultured Granulicatella sp. TaxID=316089 RepID=UPI0028DC8EA9|nr:hypothetical protein [uncultured Granulicatella sp.]